MGLLTLRTKDIMDSYHGLHTNASTGEPHAKFIRTQEPARALGFGEAKTSMIYNVFMFFSYLTPTPFPIISDAYLGRYRTLHLSLM
jgi:hypothetical protein